MRPDRDENELTLELSDGAPRESTKLITRLVIRDGEISGDKAKAMLNAAGIPISLTSANMLVSDARRMLRLLDQRGLLHPDFERRRRHASSDFIEIRRKKRRTA